jgi:NTE family protein
MQVPPKLVRVEALALEGGGTLAHAYQPIIEALAAWRPITHVAGTSAGAITAMLMAAGLSPEAIRQVQERTPWAAFSSYRPSALLRLLTTGGWHTLAFARSWLLEMLEHAGLAKSVTFAELHRLRGRHLAVIATRYERYGAHLDARPFVFSPAATPDAPVADAVLASLAVPVYWPPVAIDGWWFCDGGVATNHPLAVYAETHQPEQVLGIRVDQSTEIEQHLGRLVPQPFRPTIRQVVVANGTMLHELANHAYVPSALWSRVIRVDVGAERALDFSTKAGRIDQLRAAGAAALVQWLAE